MTRRPTSMLTSMTLLGLAIGGLPQLGFAQTDPLLGLWQLNLAKSKFSPTAPYKSLTVYFQGEGQNRKATAIGIDAAGNPSTIIYMDTVEDGKPHPVTGSRNFDAASATRVDANAVNVSYMKGGNVTQTGTIVTSADGKTYTFTTTGTLADGQRINYVFVLDKQ